MSLAHGLRLVLAPPHPAGRPFLIGGLVVAVVGGLAFGSWVFWIGVAFTLFCLYFFRDPERYTPAKPGLFIAPADGHITSVEPAVPPAELGLGDTPRWRVAIFLSVMDVHVNRIRLEDGREIAVVQIAGLIARRILCHVREGQRVRAGERFGIIRFGSRTDLYLPKGVRPIVQTGQTMIGGETVIADLSHPHASQPSGA
jgi:phosphatidylserine decarboxylase